MAPSPATEFECSHDAVAVRSAWNEGDGPGVGTGVGVGLGVGVGFGAGFALETGVELPPFEEDEENDDDGSALPAPQPAIPSVASITRVSFPAAFRLTCKLPPSRLGADAKVRLGDVLHTNDQPNALL
jgi:hypothetical protein